MAASSADEEERESGVKMQMPSSSPERRRERAHTQHNHLAQRGSPSFHRRRRRLAWRGEREMRTANPAHKSCVCAPLPSPSSSSAGVMNSGLLFSNAEEEEGEIFAWI